MLLKNGRCPRRANPYRDDQAVSVNTARNTTPDAKAKTLAILSLKRVPALTPGTDRVLQALERDDISAAKLAMLLEKCPTVVPRLIGLANSTYFGYAARVATLQRAISVVGLRMTRSLAVALLLGDTLDTRRCPSFDPLRYWFCALLTGSAARQLAAGTHRGAHAAPEEAYLSGMLLRFGLPVLAHLYPQELERALTDASRPDARLGERLRTHLGLDHVATGGWLLRKWGLPERVVTACERAREPGYRGPEWPTAVLVGACAEWADAALGENPDAGFARAALASLGIGEGPAEVVRRRCLEERATLREFASTLIPG
jgi:HD-like signal output (HDOD) protein